MNPAENKYLPLRKSGFASITFDDYHLNNVRPPMSDEEFEEFCLANPSLTIEQDKNGNIFIMAPVSYDSGNYESESIADLVIWNRKTKLGKTFSPSTLFYLPDGEKRMPDAAWIRMEKHRSLTKSQRKKFAKLVPDFIIEIKSPSDSLKDLKEKMEKIWLANGVQLAWLIDVENEAAWIYRHGKEVEEIKGLDDVLLGEGVLPGFEFDLSIFKE